MLHKATASGEEILGSTFLNGSSTLLVSYMVKHAEFVASGDACLSIAMTPVFQYQGAP